MRTGVHNPVTISLEEALALAEQHREAGRLQEAGEVCDRILAARPDEPNATHLLGLVAHQSGKLGDAIQYLQRATDLAPDVALYHANLGEMYRLAGMVDRAIAEGRRALALNPDYPEALSNLGIALYERKSFEEAASHHRRAVELNPGFALAHSNLGNALYGQKRFEEAAASYRRALELEPEFADGWANLGTALHHAGEFDEAVVALRRALALAPRHANAHSGLGILLLLRGDFGEGWGEYEWRLESSEVKGPRFPQLPWRGESLAGKRIYVQAEQGFGDTLQFARYLPMLAARGATASFRVHQSLATLIRASLPGVEVFGDRGTPEAPDYECALLSLPHLFGTRLETIPASIPYLQPPHDAATRWQARLGDLRGFKIGIVWAGNPEHVNDRPRSLDPAMLAPLLALPGASFVSLQVGSRAAELSSHPDVTDLSGALIDFAETAAAMSALDLVITVDTSVAHLAGALGKPVWLLLPVVSDWRWMLGREDSPWYPTMRLFRQRHGESWNDVMPRVADELTAVLGGAREKLTPFRLAGERAAARAQEIITVEARRVVSPPPRTVMAPAQAHIVVEQYRRAGFLREAEDLARQILAADPANTEAMHTLGIIAHQSGRLTEAIAHVQRAVEIAPDVALYHGNLGEMCRLAGRNDDAISHGRRALALKPDYPEVLSNLGIAHYERGDYEQSVGCYDRALALAPDYAEAHSNRGNALRALKRYAPAEAAYRHALTLKPDFPDAWNNLGTTLRDLKRPAEAEQAYVKALAAKPNDAETLDNLALALKDLDRLDEAAAMLRRAIAVDQGSPQLLLHLGTVLTDQGKVDEAASVAESARALAPDDHDVVNLLGRIAFERGALADAQAHFERALSLKPDLADAHNNLGNVLKEIGRLKEAEACYLRALAIAPRMAGVYVNLTDSRSIRADDPHLAAMLALENDPDLTKTERMQLHFALGKACADLGDHHHGFEHLLRGSALKREMISYDEAGAMALFDRVEQVFTRELVSAKAGAGDASQVPIFVLGMPRSGTTLVEQIIASHPRVHGAGELKTFSEIVETVHGEDGKTIPYPEFVPALDRHAAAQIGAHYVAAIRKLAPSAAHVTDKMPSNFFFAGLIHLALPNATIIHTIRDPVDTCVSCFSKLFTAEQNHTYDLAELGRYYLRYQRLMAHWRHVLPPGRILDVSYEDVVADLEGNARRIVAHCGLDWDARCLDFHQASRPVRTASATQVRQPIYTSAIGRWRVYERHLGPLLKELNRAR
ncbi:tetratricopeptide repeat protein [Bradyrhizobium diazoefficiens]|nr:tetratricopeptide repeat-containing sulfotransferase family protein [Bradyrhizobium diazoefficiens]MBR0846285.1 tetratricopeptide repeat protein [Bradyrhizobium diazoefficiens]